jgi:hypothetical protein
LFCSVDGFGGLVVLGCLEVKVRWS